MSLANDEEELKYLHQNSKIKMSKTDLANSEQFTWNIESAYRKMIQEVQPSCQPEHYSHSQPNGFGPQTVDGQHELKIPSWM